MAKKKRYEKECAYLENVEGLNGSEFLRLEIVMSRGKGSSLVSALQQYDSIVAKDLLGMINRAIDDFQRRG